MNVLTVSQMSPETHPLSVCISVLLPPTSLPFPSSHSGALKAQAVSSFHTFPVPSVTAPVLEGGCGVQAQYKTIIITVIIALYYYSLQMFHSFGASRASTKVFVFPAPVLFIFPTTL